MRVHRRVVDVAVDHGLGRPSAIDESAIEIYRPPRAAARRWSDSSLADVALFDTSNRNSVAACVIAARENARQVRDEISSEMWEQINACTSRVGNMRDDVLSAGRTNYVTRSIRGRASIRGNHQRNDGARRGVAMPAGRPVSRACCRDRHASRCVLYERGGSGGDPAAGSGGLGLAAAILLRTRELLSSLHSGRPGPSGSRSSCCSMPEFPGRSGFRARLEAAVTALARYGGRSRCTGPKAPVRPARAPSITHRSTKCSVRALTYLRRRGPAVHADSYGALQT